jgi:hypothetical protein
MLAVNILTCNLVKSCPQSKVMIEGKSMYNIDKENIDDDLIEKPIAIVDSDLIQTDNTVFNFQNVYALQFHPEITPPPPKA